MNKPTLAVASALVWTLVLASCREDRPPNEPGMTYTTSAPVPGSEPIGSDARSITISVRQNIANDATLSPLAKSVEVTTDGHTVTLRGKVSNEEEKLEVESCAMRAPGVRVVDSQLTVAR